MDFQELKEQHPAKEARLTRMEIRYKTAEIILDLQGNPVVSAIIEELKGKMSVIEEKLLYDKTLTERGRDALFVERDAWAWFLDKFLMAKETIKNTQKAIEKL